jgi:hypothetical protein
MNCVILVLDWMMDARVTNQYTSHTVDNSALVKETDTPLTRQMLGGGALSKHPWTTRAKSRHVPTVQRVQNPPWLLCADIDAATAGRDQITADLDSSNEFNLPSAVADRIRKTHACQPSRKSDLDRFDGRQFSCGRATVTSRFPPPLAREQYRHTSATRQRARREAAARAQVET